jgi:hypothetical protein
MRTGGAAHQFSATLTEKPSQDTNRLSSSPLTGTVSSELFGTHQARMTVNQHAIGSASGLKIGWLSVIRRLRLILSKPIRACRKRSSGKVELEETWRTKVNAR